MQKYVMRQTVRCGRYGLLESGKRVPDRVPEEVAEELVARGLAGTVTSKSVTKEK